MLKHTIVTGLGFGDEGKGTVVDALCARSEYGYVVRYSGGPQAAHNVIDDQGRHHTFAQFGSGTLSYTPTILSRFMMVNPWNFRNEAWHLSSVMGQEVHVLYGNTYISENSLLITPYHIAVNKAVEKQRGKDAHGSCAQGVGFAMEYDLLTQEEDKAPRMKHLKGDVRDLASRLTALSHYVRDTYNVIIKEDPWEMADDYIRDVIGDCVISDSEISSMIGEYPCVFEGSQGVLLDQWNGFHPHTTWSTTTDHNAHILLEEAGVSPDLVEVVGVTRSYGTRHGAGPFPTELKSGKDYEYLMSQEKHNKAERFQGSWRVGAFDLPLLEYAISCMDRKPDYLAMTFLDLEKDVPYTDYYDFPGEGLHINTTMTDANLEDRFLTITKPLSNISIGSGEITPTSSLTEGIVDLVQQSTGVPVRIKSYGPSRSDKKFLDS